MNCLPNCGCKVMIGQNTKDIDGLKKSIRTMIGWVIAGSGSMVLYMSILLINYILGKIG